MASRFSAARPKRAGEAFARARHGEDRDDDEGPTSKKVKFDIRNPSALAPSAQDEDDENDNVLDADVIGASGRATKRGAVNIEGFESDSENENFNSRAEARRKKGKEAEDVDLAEMMDNYSSKATLGGGGVEDEEVDMFGDFDAGENTLADSSKVGKKDKQVRFLSENDIEGQEATSKSGGTVRIDGREDSDDDDDDDDFQDDEEAIAAAMEEEGVDEEVGAGGLKKHAPKIDAFNMREEQEEGAFDEAGNYIRKAVDADAVHDRWLEGISKKEMKKAAAAHEKREAELRKQQRENDSISTGDLFKELLVRLEPGETALDALARLRRSQTKPKTKKVPKWKLKKGRAKGDDGGDAMDVDAEKEPEDPKQVKIREAINAIADAADKLLQRDFPNIYDTERERLIREYRNETGEAWVEPPEPDGDEDGGGAGQTMWEFRWTDGRDGAAKQGPFDGATMKGWQDAGYFGEGVEFRRAGEQGEWTRVATFV
jgi:CD2 antigen cytoplasmic tail-binding protein 2